MADDDKALILDSGKESLSIDEVRHLTRKMLVDVLGTLYDITQDAEAKDSDKVSAAKEIVRFAEGAKPEDEKRLVKSLSPEVRRKLARLGIKEQRANPERALLPNEEEGEWVGPGDGNAPGNEGDGRKGD